ncbi:LppM family (lipo)protein [Actinokineospora sp. HUAS TT18]|uniref:LppM family (lipo)protein n=1 Tax=Actinokineospora sp. HUAS TT18 TaxID=3447451 RepID=UPI003F52652D
MHQVTPRFRRWIPITLLSVLAALALSGCVRVQSSMTVSEDDLVTGQVIVAAVAIKQGDTGPVLTVPPELSGKVKTQVYTADGYVGQTVTFQDLTFPEVSLLADGLTVGKQYRLSIRRAGDLVTMAGAVDLTELPQDRADVQFKVTLPGTVSRTNGINDNGTISWKPKPGAVTEFNATVQYTDVSGVSWTKWVTIVGASTIGVALIVLILALYTHKRSRRVGA